MEIAVITLGIIVLAQAIERYFFAKDLHRQLENATKAVMSRNINEYLAATNEDKPQKETAGESDEVLLNEASEEEFSKYIKNQVK